MSHMKFYWLSICFVLAAAMATVCEAGEGAHGGGNPVLIRKSQISQELRQMPNYMKVVANPIVGSSLPRDSTELGIYRDIIKRDFLSDLVSPYKIVDSKLGTGECLLDRSKGARHEQDGRLARRNLL